MSRALAWISAVEPRLQINGKPEAALDKCYRKGNMIIIQKSITHICRLPKLDSHTFYIHLVIRIRWAQQSMREDDFDRPLLIAQYCSFIVNQRWSCSSNHSETYVTSNSPRLYMSDNHFEYNVSCTGPG